MGEDAGQLAHGHGSHQAVGYGNGRILPRADGEGVEHLARDIIELRNGGQVGARRQFTHDAMDIGQFIRRQRARLVETEHHLGRHAPHRPQAETTEDRRPDKASPSEDRPGDKGEQNGRPADQDDGVQRVAQVVAAPDRQIKSRGRHSLSRC
jgi:hypothetical protein